MASRTLNVVITGDAKSLNRALGSVDKQTGQVEGRLKGFSSLAKTAFKGAALAAGTFAVAGVGASIKAAVEAEKSTARLKAQLDALGISYAGNAERIDAVIQKHSQLAGIDDEDLQDAFTSVVRATGDVSSAMKQMGLVTDFARAKNIDAAKAGEIVAKVANGNTGILKRYGVAVRDGATVQEALAAAQQKFAGQAAAYGRTTAGAADRARVSLENVGEELGQRLTPYIARAAEWLNNFIRQMQSGEGAGGTFAAAIRGIGRVLRDYVIPAVKGVITVFRQMMNVVGDVVGFVLRALDKWLGVLTTIAGKFTWLPKVGGELRKMVESIDGAREGIRKTASALENLDGKQVRIHFKYTTSGDPLQNKQGKFTPPSAAFARARRPDSTPGPSILQQAQFGLSDINIAQTEFLPEADRRKALQFRQKLISSRLRQIRVRRKKVEKALKGRLKKKTRQAFLEEWLALIQEEATLINEQNGLAGDIIATGDTSDTAATGDTLAAETPFDSGASDISLPTLDATTTTDTSAADLAAAMKALADEMKRQTNFAESVAATEAGAMAKWVASVVGRAQGADVLGRGLTPSYGVARRS